MVRMAALLSRLAVYTIPQDSQVDFPEYKLVNNYDIHLVDDDFKSLDQLKEQIKFKTNAGFLNSQFFRVAFKELFEHNAQFIKTDQELQSQFQEQKKEIIYLVIVRYSRLQSYKLRNKLAVAELKQLDKSLKTKRKYAKVKDISKTDDEISILNYFEHKKSQSIKKLVDVIKSKAILSNYYSKAMIESWAQQISRSAWKSIILPPPGFPVVKQEDGQPQYMQVDVELKFYNLLTAIAAQLNQ